jgi:hypothetical protein
MSVVYDIFAAIGALVVCVVIVGAVLYGLLYVGVSALFRGGKS